MRMLDALSSINEYRSSYSRKPRRRIKRQFFSFRDAWYITVSAIVVVSFFNSQHVKIIEKPLIQKVQAQYKVNTTITPDPVSPDDRVKKLRSFFTSKGSPLADKSELFVSLADQYGLDYTLMPSISCKESSCGLALPTGSYNPFGLGGSNFMWFASWTDAITYEAQLLNSDYRQNMVAGINAKYCPSSDNCATNWTEVVMNTQYEIINQ